MTTMSKVRVLRQMALFAELPSAELVQVAYLAQPVTFPAGAELIQQGTEGETLFITTAGLVAVEVAGVGVVAQRVAPTILGEMALFTRRLRAATCRAMTEVQALQIDYADFRALVRLQPGIAIGLLAVLAARLEEADRRAGGPGAEA